MYKIYYEHNFFTNFCGWNFVSLKLLLCTVSLHNQHSWIVFTSKLPCQKELSSFSSGPLFFVLRSCRLVLINRNVMMLAITIPETKPCQNPSEGVIFVEGCWKLSISVWEQQTNCLVTCGWRKIKICFWYVSTWETGVETHMPKRGHTRWHQPVFSEAARMSTPSKPLF